MRAVVIAGFCLVLGGCIQASSEGGDASDTGSESPAETSSSESETGTEPKAWQPVFQANEEIGALMSVWGPSPDELYVVGGQPQPGGGRVLAGHDDSWTSEPLPDGVAMLNWVYGVEGSVWSVGTGGAIVRRQADAWVAEPSPTDRVLWGLWGASADELWAVGGDGVADTPVLLRRDGATDEWTSVELPPLGVDARALFKVWGRTANDVWIVGDAGATLHFDGTSWTAHPDLDGIDLISVWGSDSDGVIAVGGRASGRVDRLVGAEWSGETFSVPGLNGVWVDPEAGATTVGVQGSIFTISPGSLELVPEESGTAMVLHSVFGFAGGPRYAVGGSLLMPAPFVGVILQAP